MSESDRWMRCKECRTVYRESAIKRQTGFCRCGGQKWTYANPTRLGKIIAKLMGRA